MNIEKAVLEIVETINFAGLSETKVEERKVYLCLIAVVLLNQLEMHPHLKILFTSSDGLDEFTESVKQYLFSKSSHKGLYVELIERLSLISEAQRHLLLDKTAHLVELNYLNDINKQNAIVIYCRVLQRLQTMNETNKLSREFTYQDRPSSFSTLVTSLFPKKDKHCTYDPYAMTGELSAFYAMNNNIELAITETILQTSCYLNHMFCIAGAERINALHSFALSPIANIEAEVADVAFTLLEPTASKVDVSLHIGNDNEATFSVQDGRIADKIVPQKYKEHAFIQQILYSLKKDGVGIIFLGKGALHREIEREARSFLLHSNFVDAVIELPPKLITPRTTTLYALVLKKNRTNSFIKFINASSCFEAAGRRNELTKLDEISKLYNTRDPIAGRVSIISIAEVAANDYLLTPSSYLSEYTYFYSPVDFEDMRQRLINQGQKTDKILAEIFNELN